MKAKIYHTEKDLPNVPFIMIVVTNDDKEHPYYAKNVTIGNITGIPVIEGEFIEDIIKEPLRILQFAPGSMLHQSLYIQDKNQKHPGVNFFRKIGKIESKIWKEKVAPLQFQDLPDSCIKSCGALNEKAKELFVALYEML